MNATKFHVPLALIGTVTALLVVSTINFFSPAPSAQTSMLVGCTKQEGTQIETALTPLESCEINELEGGAIENPIQLITGCIGATAVSLVNIAVALLSDALGTPLDATTALIDAAAAPLAPKVGTGRLPMERVQHLQRVVGNLRAYIADGGK